MNIRTAGTGSSGSIDPIPSGSKSTEPTAPQTSRELSVITNIVDLKKAELRGEKHSVSDEQIVREIERSIKAVQGKTTSLKFSVHEQTNMVAVKVLDSESGEVIREIPPEKTLDFVAKLWEMAGVLIDEKR